MSIENPRIITFEEYVKLPNRSSLRYQLSKCLRQQIVEQPSGCWRWTGHITDEGYGRARFLGGEHAAHRLVWRILKGQLDAKQDPHHTCGQAACVRPLHLKPMSRSKHLALHGRERRKRNEQTSVAG